MTPNQIDRLILDGPDYPPRPVDHCAECDCTPCHCGPDDEEDDSE